MSHSSFCFPFFLLIACGTALEPSAEELGVLKEGGRTWKLTESHEDSMSLFGTARLQVTETDQAGKETLRWDGRMPAIPKRSDRRAALWVDEEVIAIAYVMDTVCLFEAPRDGMTIFPKIGDDNKRDHSLLNSRMPWNAIKDPDFRAIGQEIVDGKGSIFDLKRTGKSYEAQMKIGEREYLLQSSKVGTPDQSFELTPATQKPAVLTPRQIEDKKRERETLRLALWVFMEGIGEEDPHVRSWFLQKVAENAEPPTAVAKDFIVPATGHRNKIIAAAAEKALLKLIERERPKPK